MRFIKNNERQVKFLCGVRLGEIKDKEIYLIHNYALLDCRNIESCALQITSIKESASRGVIKSVLASTVALQFLLK